MLKNKNLLLKIHTRPYGDPNLFQYALFKEFNIDKQPNAEQAGILLRMFFALTSSDYDIQKGIKKVFYFLTIYYF